MTNSLAQYITTLITTVNSFQVQALDNKTDCHMKQVFIYAKLYRFVLNKLVCFTRVNIHIKAYNKVQGEELSGTPNIPVGKPNSLTRKY